MNSNTLKAIAAVLALAAAAAAAPASAFKACMRTDGSCTDSNGPSLNGRAALRVGVPIKVELPGEAGNGVR